MKRNFMKTIFYTFLLVFGISSCTNLDIKETDSIISEGFQGLADPSSTVDEIINRMRGHYENQANKYALDEVTTDEFLIPTRGTDWGDNGRWRNLHNHEWNEEASDIIDPFNEWNGSQLLASQVLDSRSSPSATNIGEASFLRAYAMYLVLDWFGQVPFRDVTLPSSELPAVLTGTDAVNFIIADLDQAISNLSSLPAGASPGIGAGESDRPSKEAAKYLKAKVLLNKGIYDGSGAFESGDMTQVITLVDEIAGQGYALESMPYYDIFKNTPDSETIWSLGSSVGNRMFNGLHYNSTTIGGGGWNGFSTLAEFYDLFEGDANNNRVDLDLTPLDLQEPRRGGVPNAGLPFTGRDGTTDNGGFEDGSNVGFGFLIGQQYDLDGTALQDRAGAPLAFTRGFVDGSGTPSLINNNEITGIRLMKYGMRFGGFTGHQPVFRYADAYLMKAEAMWRNGGDPLTMVNTLRNLRGATPLGSIDGQGLLDERGRELFGETWRRNDLKRFGQYLRAWEFKPSSEVGNQARLLFPIPAQQLLANPNLVQNCGYPGAEPCN
ncbi:MAG: RagB/SusD family nutrient uptake outer membrane protein [Flavobacteriaceae bacterium]